MTDQLQIIVDDDRLLEAVRRAPVLLEKELHDEIYRVVHIVARDAKDFASKGGTSILTNSINAFMAGPLEGIVAPGVEYAQYVEQGTEPGYFPPYQNILDWVEQTHQQPQYPGDDKYDIAWRIALNIFYTGTEKQPFMEPSLEKNRATAERRLNAAIDRALEAA